MLLLSLREESVAVDMILNNERKLRARAKEKWEGFFVVDALYIYHPPHSHFACSRGNSPFTGNSILELCGEAFANAVIKIKVFVPTGFIHSGQVGGSQMPCDEL